MAHKTKAAIPGRQCNNTKHIQDTSLVAGGQSLVASKLVWALQLSRLGGMSKNRDTLFGSTNFSVYQKRTVMVYISQSFDSSLSFSQRRQINRVVTSLSHSFLELVGSFPSKSSEWLVQNAGPIHPNYPPSSRYSRKPYRIIAIQGCT